MENELQKLVRLLNDIKTPSGLAQVAKGAGVSKKTVDRIISGKTDPVYSSVIGLTEAAKVYRKSLKRSP